MIKVILKDKLNPHRAESCVYETTDPERVNTFIQGLRKGLLKNHWEIKISWSFE